MRDNQRRLYGEPAARNGETLWVPITNQLTSSMFHNQAVIHGVESGLTTLSSPPFMEHIMSIEQAKKQAKNLRKMLPNFISEHPNGAKLADFQELIAQTLGYPNFHQMSESYKTSPHRKSSSVGELFAHYEGIESWEIFDTHGSAKTRKIAYASLKLNNNDGQIDNLTEEFDDARESEGGLTGSFDDYSPHALNKIIRLATKLIKREPSFIEGYAFLAGAYITLDENAKAITIAQPVVSEILRKIDLCAHENGVKELLIPYTFLSNRPFHRLAHALTLAYLNSNNEIMSNKANELAKKMLKLWPNDNIGFRFLIEDDHGIN